jgi:hypothetical protein
MPSRKQRRRRQKLYRHEYEYVEVDEEGNEIPVDPAELRQRAEATNGAGPARAQRNVRQQRGIQPPSWRRIAKRGLIFFPFMLITVHLLSGDELSNVGKVLNTVVLMAFFMPFSYVMDAVMYRTYLKRTGQAPAKKN